MKKNQWIIVKDKKTYLFLLSIPAVIIYLIIDGMNLLSASVPMVTDFITHCFIGLIFMFICIYFFIRFNSYSHIYNPDHPKS